VSGKNCNLVLEEANPDTHAAGQPIKRTVLISIFVFEKDKQIYRSSIASFF
jgi:hypothetical protein